MNAGFIRDRELVLKFEAMSNDELTEFIFGMKPDTYLCDPLDCTPGKVVAAREVARERKLAIDELEYRLVAIGFLSPVEPTSSPTAS